MTCRIMIIGFAAWVTCAAAKEIGYVEQFSLAKDREEALKQLIPGTEDYYYYHCLHFQHVDEFEKVEEMLKLWIKRYKYTPRVQEIRNRQALLLYDKQPQASLKHIKDRLNLRFNHQKIELEQEVPLPVSLNKDLISHETLTTKAFTASKNLSNFEDSAFDFLVRAELNPDQRRHLLSRLRRPDYAGLPQMVVDDLKYKHSGGFGSHPIHAALLLDQLEQCLKLMPKLIKQTNFINTYLTKLQPGSDIDWRGDPNETDAYLQRLLAFVRRLPPAQNSLKTHVLYQRLLFDEKRGIHSRDLFMEYIRLPRNVFYMNPDYLRRKEHQGVHAELSSDYHAHTAFPPIGHDEPLVRRIVMNFLRDADSIDVFSDYIEHNYLNEVFSETKMVNGIGDMEQWYSLLSPAKVRALRERVDIALLPVNDEFIEGGEEVTLDVAIKNVDKLIVKTYEINTRSYFHDNLSEITTAIDLDGLVSNHEETFAYTEVPLRRHVERFEFPHIRESGVYVIELIGNGISSRALIRKGRLTFTQRIGSAGHVFIIYDESGNKLSDASIWLSGHEHIAEENGEIAVPFSSKPGRQKIVIRHGEFAALGEFDHQAESYSLGGGIYAERESLVAGETCRVLIRAELSVNAIPVAIKLLEEIALSIQSIDIEGISTTKEVNDLELSDDDEFVYEFKVPDDLASLNFTLRGKVQNLSLNEKMHLEFSKSIAVNGISHTDKTEALHLRRTRDEFRIELLGKTGEPRPDRAVHLTLKHRDFKRIIDVTLKTNRDGHIDLGNLADIVKLTASGPEKTTRTWRLDRDRCVERPVVHGLVREPMTIPYMGAQPKRIEDVISLLELRGGTYVRDVISHARIKDGFIVIEDLDPGDYDLFIKPESRRVLLRITAGKRVGAQLLSRDRVLEQRVGAPLQMSEIVTAGNQIKLRVQNATPETRIHIVATRFVPEMASYYEIGVPLVALPAMHTLRRPQSQYLSGRNIGDEYRYILERRYAPKYPGNMLRNPSLLLNPWSLRKTDTGVDRAAEGEAWASEPLLEEAERGARSVQHFAKGDGRARSAFASFDFLPTATAVLENLRLDQKGGIRVEREALGGGRQIHIVAINRDSAVYRKTALAPSDESHRDRRLTKILDPKGHFTERRRVSIAPAETPFIVEDIRSSKIELYDSLAKVYRLYATLSGDATLTEFGFILGWPRLEAEKKRALYSKYACHELNVFLHEKDPQFFDDVIRPYLANKKDKTFMDHWLLNADLSAYLEPWAYHRLNIAERALLGRRINAEAEHASRHAKDRYDLIPPNMERFNHFFKTAIRAGALETAGVAFDAAWDDVTGESLRAEEFNALGAPAATEGQMTARKRSLELAAGEDMAKYEFDELSKYADVSKQSEPPVGSGIRIAPVAADMERFDDGRRDVSRRERARQFYQKLDKTEEWVENNYYKIPIEQQTADHVTVNGFWKDAAGHANGDGFLSPNVAEASRNFTEMMLALAVLDLPFESGHHEITRQGAQLEITPTNDIIVFHKQVRDAEESGETQVILISQNFFARDDRYRHEDNERFDKFVTEEFKIARVYGCHIVLTNPTSTRRKVDVLLQIPEGSLPVLNGFYTRSLHMQLEPYSTQAVEYYFYFSSPGEFRHYPVHVSQDEQLIGFASPFVFNVKTRLSEIDTEAWPYVSQHGTDAQVFTHLKENNIDRLDLNLIAFRMKDKESFRTVMALLRQRHVYSNTLWSYGIYHNDASAIREYLPHTPFANQCGLFIDSTLLTLNPVARHAHQHKEYWPLVNARVYPLGKTRKILNQQFHTQYHDFLRLLQYRASLSDADFMDTMIYLLLQNRVEDAMAFFDQISPTGIEASIQYNYLKAYMAFYRESPGVAREIATSYAEHPVARWRNLFGDVIAQADEIEGRSATVVDEENRMQQHTALADTAPGLELKVENRVVSIRHQNVKACTVNFYPMDIELLFSKQPFVQDIGGQFSIIRPNQTVTVTLMEDRQEQEIQLPEVLRDSNVMIEVSAAGITRRQAYYPHSLGVHMMENYGQLRITHEETGKPLPKVYVKVYARMKDGRVQFFKDGYTDLRGRFDYTSLNTNEIEYVDKFSMLIMSDEHGALIREAAPPKM
jgi:hypothetical protein